MEVGSPAIKAAASIIEIANANGRRFMVAVLGRKIFFSGVLREVYAIQTHRHVRNPMISGVMFILLGEVLLADVQPLMTTASRHSTDAVDLR